jgi:hypothetical protein
MKWNNGGKPPAGEHVLFCSRMGYLPDGRTSPAHAVS